MNHFNRHVLLGALIIGCFVSPSFAKKADTGVDFIDDGSYKLTLGNWATYGKRGQGNRGDGDKEGYSNTYLHAFFETADWHGLQLGVGFHGHLKTWDNNETYEYVFEDDAGIYNSDFYLKYNFTELTSIKGGRFNTREIANHLDPQYGQGILLDFKEVDNLRIQLGVINKFAAFWEDGYRGFYDLDKAQDYPGLSDEAHADLGEELYLIEMNYYFTDFIWINPYFYHQDNYVDWFGMDTHLGTMTEWGAYGTTFYAYQVEPLFDSINPDDEEGSFNWQFKPYVNLGNFQFDLGYARFGRNELVNRPTYGYKYMTGIVYEGDAGAVEFFDYNQSYAKKNAKVYFGRINYALNRWSLYCTFSQTDAEENDVLELQVGGSFDITNALKFGTRIVDYNYESSDDNAAYVEVWIFYDF